MMWSSQGAWPRRRAGREAVINQWNRNPRPQLEPRITSLEKYKINYSRNTSLPNWWGWSRGLLCHRWVIFVQPADLFYSCMVVFIMCVLCIIWIRLNKDIQAYNEGAPNRGALKTVWNMYASSLRQPTAGPKKAPGHLVQLVGHRGHQGRPF